MTGPTAQPEDRRAVDRLVNFSDAVVAVAVTLLALPLVDIAGPAAGETIGTVLVDHASEIGTFLFTFAVVAIMWLAHNRLLNGLVRYDGAVFWLNTAWLALIVLLPWVSSMFGVSGSGYSDGVALLYWSALSLISLVGAAIGWHLRRHPGLEDARHRQARSGPGTLRGVVFGGYFLLIGVTSLFWADLASWLPLGIIALSMWLRPERAVRQDDDHATAS